MHTNFYFLRQLAPALAHRLTGLRFMACFSQDRDEVVLVFAQAKGKLNYYKPYYIKATLRPDFSGLLFPETVQRARANSVDLFDDLTNPAAQAERQPDESAGPVRGESTPGESTPGESTPGESTAPAGMSLRRTGPSDQPGRAVVDVRFFLNERCLTVVLESGYALLFKFFGNRPNLLAFREDTVIDLFNHNLTSDWQLVLSALDRPIDQSYEAFERAGFDYRKLFPTFGKVVNRHLEQKKEPGGTVTWDLIQDVLRQLERPRYYLLRIDHKPTLSLLPIEQPEDPDRLVPVWEFDEPIEAANRFFIAYNGLSTFEHEKAEWLRLLDKRRKRAQAQIEGNMQRLVAREEGVSHEQMGHILMAHLHDIPEPPGARSPERITLFDFYRDQPITIKLKPDLSPQKNAENYYRKAKNEKIEEEHLTNQVTAREAEIGRMNQQRTELEAITTLKELRRYVKQHNLLQDAPSMASSDGAQAQLFKEVLVDDFRILIGRNAKNNDLLTQKYAHKEDLWLHARDVAGSHVIVKYKAGKTFPKNVIERAAELAAWYSKRRTDSLCPVTVTLKKFVRKPKGLAEGQVIVEKEDVVMVVPRGE